MIINSKQEIVASIRLQRQNETTENINSNSCYDGIFTGVVLIKITFHLYSFAPNFLLF
jgi:hypothetical protein